MQVVNAIDQRSNNMQDSSQLRHYWWAVLVIISLLAASCASAPKPSTPPPTQPSTTAQAQATPSVVASSPPGVAQSAPSPTTAPPKTDIWPKIYTDETYMTTFASSLSEADAVGAIKNLQNSFVEFNAGLPFSEFDVDPYGLRAKWQWVENNFVKSASLIIPFDQVTSILLEHYPALDRDYKWGINVYISGGSTVSLRTPTRDAAQRLGNAIMTLAKARKAPLNMPNPLFGAALGALSDAQAQAAGILKTSGIIVLWVFNESPAEKAGFSAQDIITAAGGKEIHTGDDLFSAVNTAAAAGATQLRIDGIRRSYKVENGKYVEIFVPVTYTLPIEQKGGAQ